MDPHSTACQDFIETLNANAPHPDLADKMRLYGRLIGRWKMHAVLRPSPGERCEADGDIVFGWILSGRAIQDVWTLPGWFYGTTLRIYDPALDAWHILWNEPIKQYYTHMIGCAEDNGIVQLGQKDDGTPIRWRFRDITPDAFRWTGEVGRTDGTWFLNQDFAVRRV